MGRCRSANIKASKARTSWPFFVVEYGELGAAVLDSFHGDLEQATEALDDSYVGQYESLAGFADELTQGKIEEPQSLTLYIDYEAMGRDLELGGEILTVETVYQEVHIFWNQ